MSTTCIVTRVCVRVYTNIFACARIRLVFLSRNKNDFRQLQANVRLELLHAADHRVVLNGKPFDEHISVDNGKAVGIRHA